MMISLLFHRYPSVPCQGCTVTNFRCLPAERDTVQDTHIHLHIHTHHTPEPKYAQTPSRLRTHTDIDIRTPPFTHLLRTPLTSLTEAALWLHWLARLGMMQSKSIVQLTTHVDTNPSYDYDPFKQVNASQCNVSHTTPRIPFQHTPSYTYYHD